MVAAIIQKILQGNHTRTTEVQYICVLPRGQFQDGTEFSIYCEKPDAAADRYCRQSLRTDSTSHYGIRKVNTSDCQVVHNQGARKRQQRSKLLSPIAAPEHLRKIQQ